MPNFENIDLTRKFKKPEFYAFERRDEANLPWQ
jgi:hypothetical protein